MDIFAYPLLSILSTYVILLMLCCRCSSAENASLSPETNNNDVTVPCRVHASLESLPNVTTTNRKAILQKPIKDDTLVDDTILKRDRRFFGLPFRVPLGPGYGNFGYGNRGYGGFGHGHYGGLEYGHRGYEGYGRKRGGSSWDSREDDR